MVKHVSLLSGFKTLLFVTALAQPGPPADPVGSAISQRAADSISKNAFAKMVAGNEDVTNLANYVSFNSTDGKFTLAGNYFFQVRKKDSKKKRPLESFAVGFNGTGSMPGGTVANLFETGEIATGLDVGLKLSWRMNKPNVGSISAESWPMRIKRSALQFERDQKIDSAKQAIALADVQLSQARFSVEKEKAKLQPLNDSLAKFSALLSGCKDATCASRYTDSILSVRAALLKTQQKIQSLDKEVERLKEVSEVALIDPAKKYEDRTSRERFLSDKYGLDRINFSYEDTVLNKIRYEYEEKIFQVEMARPVAGMRINWLSGIFNWNQVSYRSYFPALPFADAIPKIDTQGHTIGLQANFYTFYRPVRTARLFNIAVLFKKTNNLGDLTPSKITDEVTEINGSTTRKKSKEYTVYTDTVKLYNTVQIPLNYYRFFGKDLQFGWHAFGLADLRDNDKQVYDLGAGFIFGLNTEGAKRLLNIELFAKYRDLNREIVDEDETGWKQLTFGLSVAVPFMIYKK